MNQPNYITKKEFYVILDMKKSTFERRAALITYKLPRTHLSLDQCENWRKELKILEETLRIIKQEKLKALTEEKRSQLGRNEAS